MLKKILSKLNVHLDDNQKWLCLSMFILGIIGTYTQPTIVKEIISNLPAQWIAIDALVSSLSVMLAGMVWKGKFRQSICNAFVLFCCLESAIAFLVGMYLTFIEWNVWVFAISNLVYVNLISVFVSKCIMTFKTKLWKDKDREIYDNNVSIIGGITCIIGFGASLLCLPNLFVAMLLWSTTCLVDNIAWMYVYTKNKNVLTILNNEE